MIPGRLIGVDVGGSKIKGAVVEIKTGELVGQHASEHTPSPPTPSAMSATIAEIVERLDSGGRVGIGLPCALRGGVVRVAANIDPLWVGTDAVALLSGSLGRSVAVLNDADAAGLAEATVGAARERSGTAVLLTFGTGIGSALLHAGRLVPNTEFGHLRIADDDGLSVVAESIASARVREQERLSWPEWAARTNRLLDLVAMATQADLLVIGGGMGEPRKVERWRGLLHSTVLHSTVDVVPAVLGNKAGIVGAALRAAELNGWTGGR